jgi:CPA2 family monovalent cation:H+ antiporter-2
MAGIEAEFLLDFSIIIVIAAIIILLFHRLRQPIVLGYLLAGMLIGPYVPYFPTVENTEIIDAIAGLAIIVIMFSLGLTFSLSRLRSIGLVATVTGTIVIVSMILIGYSLGLAFGWSEIDSFFLGAMIAISSTAVITKGILERDERSERSSQIVTGILIVEDLAVVVILTMIAGISVTGELRFEGLLLTIINITLFIILFLAFGFLIAPRVVKYAAGTGSKELLLITVLGLCFGFALLGHLLGFSSAIGAFVAGAVLGELSQQKRIIEEVRPVKNVFSAVFFISIGMLVDPAILMDYWIPIIIVAGVFILAKMSFTTAVTFLFGTSARTALKVGLMMAVLGEFSYIIAREGNASGVISGVLYPVIIMASALTILVGTQLNKHQDGIIGTMARRTPESVQRYVAFISLSINQLRSRASVSHRISDSTREHVKEIMMDVVIILCTALGLNLGLAYSSAILDYLGLGTHLQRAFEIGLLVLALVIIITAFIALIRRVFRLVEEATFPILISDKKKRALKKTIAYQALRAIVTMVAILGGAFLVTFIMILLTSSPLYLLFLAAAVVVIAYVFKRTVSSFNERFKATFREGLRVKEDGAPPHRDLPVSEILQGADEMCTLSIEPGSKYDGMAIGSTDFWRRTDTAILAIRRDKGVIIDPLDDEKIRADDMVIFLEGCLTTKRDQGG